MKKSWEEIVSAVNEELISAVDKYPSMYSAHEGYSILAEEVDELWDLVKVKQGKRDGEHMQKEAIQIAAMAIRFAYDVCYKQGGQK